MNCPKCIIDGGRMRENARHLIAMAMVWDETIKDMEHDLTDAEHGLLLSMEDEFCAFSDLLDENIAKWNALVCDMAKGHSRRKADA